MTCMRTAILRVLFLEVVLTGAATGEPPRVSEQVVSVVNDPRAALIRGHVVGLKRADIDGTNVTVKVEQCFLGNVGDSIQVFAGYAVKYNKDNPIRPLEVTDVAGAIWYKVGDTVLLLVEPFESASISLPGLFRREMVRFVTKDSKSGEDMTFIQTGHQFPSPARIKERLAAGEPPTLEEWSAAVERSFKPDGTLKQTVSDLLALRKH
jgi:hypothetical protein